MFDRCGRLGVVVGDDSSKEFLRGDPNRVFARDVARLGGVEGGVTGASFCSSFFLMNQRLRPLPWTLMVSVAFGSMPPTVQCKRPSGKEANKNIQPILIIAILNFFQVQRYEPPLTLAMTSFTSSKLKNASG